MTDYRPRIVIVDDSEADVFLLKMELKRHSNAGHVSVLDDGAVASQFFRELSVPCVVVLDMNLPKCDGLSVLRTIRENSVVRDIPVIVLTGIPNPKEEKEVLAMDARLYRVKPTDFEGFEVLAREIVNICSGLANAATG